MAYKLDISSDEADTLSDLLADQAVIVLDATNNRVKILAKDSAGDSITTFLRPSQRLVQLLTQTAGNAPVATTLENDFPAATTLTWARTSAGLYTLTASTAIFTAAKTTVRFGTPIPVDDIASVEAVITSTTVITIKTKNYKTSDDTAGVLDGLLTNTAIVIEVYP
jgi:hypothetical protein